MKIQRHRWQQDLGAGVQRCVQCLVILAFSPVIPFGLFEAVEAEPVASSQTFAVALPELEGPVTLGIFSPNGNLVRLLYRDAAIESIPAGLNGLILTWDEKDASGKAVPAGTYRARGLVHGPVAAAEILRPWVFDPQPVSEASWPECLINGGSELNSPGCPFPDLSDPFPSNSLFVKATRDELLSRRPLLSISARADGDAVLIDAEGLPLISIPLDRKWDAPRITLRYVLGIPTLTLRDQNSTKSYSLSGLDHLVPLEAGTLEIPADAFHSAPIGEESRR